MLLLTIFAVLAGAGTALTPCVLPVLPALLSASAAGGRRRPLGVILGLVSTHTIAIVALASVIDGVGLADGFVRSLAVVVLAAFGVALLWPRLGLLVERAFAPLQRLGPRSRGEGFWSGLLVGGALGFLYAPCAGPILAAVISVSATQGTSADLVVLALAYGAGSAVVLLLIAFGGRRVVDRIRGAGHGPVVQRTLGALLIATAALMAAELDVRFQTVLANELPAALSNPTTALEGTSAVKRRLEGLRGAPRFESTQPQAAGLPKLGRAPDFTGNDSWLNTPGGRPLSLAELRGKVVLVDFWTYTCINCLRTLPALRAWYQRYADDGLEIVGVHTPEFAFERERDNVERAVRANGLRYPIAQDNSYATWRAWGNQYWPAKYLIDARGQVRYTQTRFARCSRRRAAPGWVPPRERTPQAPTRRCARPRPTWEPTARRVSWDRRPRRGGAATPTPATSSLRAGSRSRATGGSWTRRPPRFATPRSTRGRWPATSTSCSRPPMAGHGA